MEIHVQLSTKTKMFSNAAASYGARPNTQVSIVDLGFSVVLPVINLEEVTMAIKFSLAINVQLNHYSMFARKNYFYPDLSKGYQIS